jgi:hypothetical protein
MAFPNTSIDKYQISKTSATSPYFYLISAEGYISNIFHLDYNHLFRLK